MKRIIVITILMICIPVSAGELVYKLTPAEYPIYVDGNLVKSDIPALKYTTSIGDTTMLPLRAVLEATGAKVDWTGKVVNITSKELKFNDIKNLTDKCVMIKVYKDGRYVSQGSGVIIGDVIVTCSHVLKDGNVYKVCYNNSLDIVNNTKEYEARKIKEDENIDIAILDNPEKKYTGIKLGDSSNLKYGDPAIIIGSPKETKNVVSFGTISGFLPSIVLNKENDLDNFLCFTGDANPGSSGGALINARDGTLIGIVNAGNHGTYGQLKDSCAIPINDVKKLLE